MSLDEAALLGFVQGVTEFLPISSSGHLVLVPWVLGWPRHGLVFDTALHLGTLVALLAYFWHDWVELSRAMVAGLANPEARSNPGWRLAWTLVVGNIPAAAAGWLFIDQVETLFRQPTLVASFLILFGLLLLLSDRLGDKSREIDGLTFRDAIAIGFAQALSLMPGVSRSGVTLTAGLLLGLERAAAARYSFLLSSPLVLGAGLYELSRWGESGFTPGDLPAFIIGIGVSAVVGYSAIGFLLRYLQRRDVTVFVWYRLLFGVAILALQLFRG